MGTPHKLPDDIDAAVFEKAERLWRFVMNNAERTGWQREGRETLLELSLYFTYCYQWEKALADK